jgi:hypothetical protein
MEAHELAAHAAILTMTAREAVEELDAVREHPEVVDSLRELAGFDRLGEILNGASGGDPAAYVLELADGLEPFRQELMDDEPELVERLIVVAHAVQRASTHVFA